MYKLERFAYKTVEIIVRLAGIVYRLVLKLLDFLKMVTIKTFSVIRSLIGKH